jgi:hypothetical protein
VGKPKGARTNLHKFLSGTAVQPAQPQLQIS